MNEQEMLIMQQHTQALDEHTIALKGLTAMLGEIFEERNTIAGTTEVHPLHRMLTQFASFLEENTSQNQQIAATIEDAAKTMQGVAANQYDAANAMKNAASTQYESANTMKKAAHVQCDAADTMRRSAAYR